MVVGRRAYIEVLPRKENIMKTLEQLKQLLINALQGEDYVDYLCQIQEGIVENGLLEEDDELYYIDVCDDDRLLHYIEYSGMGVWDFLSCSYDANANFINYDFCTLRCSELRDLYLEKLFTDNYEDTLCDLFFYDYGEEDESLTRLAEELIAFAPRNEPEEDMEQILINGLNSEDYEEYVDLINKSLNKYLDNWDKLCWHPNDEDTLWMIMEYNSGNLRHFLSYVQDFSKYDRDADFVNPAYLETKSYRKLRDLYLGHLFTDGYENILPQLLEDIADELVEMN
jgi:hypothetical protein